MKKQIISFWLLSLPCIVLAQGGNPGDGDGTLPVVWKGFSAARQGDKVLLRWETASEQHSKYFVVEHRGTGTGWDSLGTVAAAGNSTSARSYVFTHNRPPAGLNQYRLRQQDLDGRESLSKTINVRLNNESGLTVLGNPVTQGVMRIRLEQPALVTLQDPSGRRVYSVRQSAGVQAIDVSRLAKGYYLLEVGGTVDRVWIR